MPRLIDSLLKHLLPPTGKLRPDQNQRPKMEFPNPAAADPLEQLVGALQTALSPVTHPQSASASPMAIPANYSGEAVKCSCIYLHVSLYIEMQSQKFSSERA